MQVPLACRGTDEHFSLWSFFGLTGTSLSSRRTFSSLSSTLGVSGWYLARRPGDSSVHIRHGEPRYLLVAVVWSVLFCTSEFRSISPALIAWAVMVWCAQIPPPPEGCVGRSRAWVGSRAWSFQRKVPRAPQRCHRTRLLLQLTTSSGLGWEVESAAGGEGTGGVCYLWRQREKVTWLLCLFINSDWGAAAAVHVLRQLQVRGKASVRLALKGKIIPFYRLCLKSGGRCSSRGSLCRDSWQINLQ